MNRLVIFLFVSVIAFWFGCGSDVAVFGPVGNGGAGGSGGSILAGGLGASDGNTTATTSSSSSSGQGGSSDSCGDGRCGPGETPDNCPQDCKKPSTCEHPICEVGEPLEPGCDECVDKVCAEDGYCCNNWWDDTCVGLADQLCNTGCCGNGMCEGQTCASCPDDCGVCVCGDGKCEGENCGDCAKDCGPCPSCAHTSCTVGAALVPSDCRPACVKEVCQQDATCCSMGWRLECTALAASLCSGTDPCVEKVCAKEAACCMSGWDANCVALAKKGCTTDCNCAHDICMKGSKLDSTCDPCVASICEADPYCCNNDWDGVCVGEVGSVCGVVCN